jgi:signal transduction histidine kinase
MDPDLKLEPTLCQGLVDAIVASLRSHAHAKGMQLLVTDSSEDIITRTDRRILSRIVIGLVTHAIENAHGGMLRVCVSRARGPRMITIGVEQVGTQHTPSQPRTEEDVWSGLSLCYSFAALLGGNIAIYSERGDGNDMYVLQFPER